jgi:hypothetical protein
VVAGALYLADLGYYQLARFCAIADADAFWLSRSKAGTVIYDSDGQRWDEVTDLLEGSADGNVVDMPVEIGARERLPGRLVAVRAPQEVVDQRRCRAHAAMARTWLAPVSFASTAMVKMATSG